MSFLDRARERALAASEQVRSAAQHATEQVTGASGGVPEVDGAELATPPPGTDALRLGLNTARAGLATLVDRLDPALVADVVIKATLVQERANLALHDKGSAYRIDGISITATIPPQISFSIGRSAADED